MTRIQGHARKPIVDSKIELTDAELRESREFYDREQARIGAELAAKKRDKAAYFYAMDVRDCYLINQV